MTAALEGGEWSATRPRPHFIPGKDPVPILQENGCAPRPVWTGGKSRPHRDTIPDRPARSRYTDWATRPTYKKITNSIYRAIQNDCRGHTQYTPDATPCDFFQWGYVKDQVYAPPLRASIPELKVRIRTAVEIITADMLQTVWNELDYRVDVCRITKGTYIEHL